MYGNMGASLNENAAMAHAKDLAYRAQQSGQLAGGATAQRTSEAILKDLASRLEFLDRLAHRAENLGDRICGQQPQNVAKDGAPIPSPESLQGKLSVCVQFADVLTMRFEQALSRLESFV